MGFARRTSTSSARPSAALWPASWNGAGPVFVELLTTGNDPAVDEVTCVRARKLEPGQSEWQRFERDLRPRQQDTSARGEPTVEPPSAIIAHLREWIGSRPVLVARGESFLERMGRLDMGADLDLVVLGLDEARALWLPGTRPPDVDPSLEQLPAAFSELYRGCFDLDPALLAVAVAGLACAWKRLRDEASPWAEALALALWLAERPEAWAEAAGRWSPEQVSALLDASGDWEVTAREGAEELEPLCAREGRQWSEWETVPVHASGRLSLDESDLALVDECFQVHLPALLGEGKKGPGPSGYRPGQHAVAREIGRSLGTGELLLVAAPTGTGKTLAYLVPSLLWALRNNVRVGLSTYTRALQEQAAEREVPRAKALLARAGLGSELRASVLKGRANYLCWRSLLAHQPGEEDGAGTWLAWTALTIFACRDAHSDLDRFPPRLPFDERGDGARAWQGEFESLVAAVRATGTCCAFRDDRERCAAELARQRAERSHVVLTNHAFLLARQGFFRHVIADECEHLHDQARGAWSHELSLRQVHATLARLGGGAGRRVRAGERGPLQRLARQALLLPPLREALTRAGDLSRQAARAADRLGQSFGGFQAWREEVVRQRDSSDAHSLLREFLEQVETLEPARLMRETQRDLWRALRELEACLGELTERLASTDLTGLARVRRGLELARGDLVEQAQILDAWIPLAADPPPFLAQTYYDLERAPSGEDVMVARVLLPNEFLGRKFLPELESGVFLSATTWLRGSFDAALGYLGLDRAEHPAEDEEREGRVVHTFRAPDPFDYSRVVVCIPSDAPDARDSREQHLDYVRRFLAHLGERTRGRILGLFTNADELARVGRGLEGFFRARGIPFWYQNMPGRRKEDLAKLFRARADSILLGVDTFWYGADFPGETLEYLVIARLPYGVPDPYHFAQCAALGAQEQRRRIYLPRALGKFRQGFGRLMRRENDRGAVFLLDRRVLEGRHRFFLSELPLERRLAGTAAEPTLGRGARLVTGTTDECARAALQHMSRWQDVLQRGLDAPFGQPHLGGEPGRSPPPVSPPSRGPRGEDDLVS